MKSVLNRSLKTTLSGLVFASMLAAYPAYAQTVLVTVGEDGADMDACGGYGEVHNLDPNGDNYLSVRARPSSKGRELDRLSLGTGVSMCTLEGRWVGIVYSKNGQDCGVGSPVSSPRGYTGPCQSGWVFDKYVDLIAG